MISANDFNNWFKISFKTMESLTNVNNAYLCQVLQYLYIGINSCFVQINLSQRRSTFLLLFCVHKSLRPTKAIQRNNLRYNKF